VPIIAVEGERRRRTGRPVRDPPGGAAAGDLNDVKFCAESHTAFRSFCLSPGKRDRPAELTDHKLAA
jgi:hypothetical protein